MNIKFENVNKKLLDVYENWEESLLVPYIEYHTVTGYYSAEKDIKHERDKNKCLREGTQISCPFYMGLTDDYINSDKKRVMIIGQEARGYGVYTADKNKEGFEPESSQKWSKCYLSRQTNLQEADRDLKYNASRFWALFRALKTDYALCWTDIDKVYYNKLQDNKDGKYTGTLTYGGEAYLNQKYGEDNKSILEREIELAEPDYVVFVIGPNYHVSLEKSFGFEYKKLSEEWNKQVKDKKWCDITNVLAIGKPAVWTYHPAARNVDVIAAVKEALSQLQKKV